MAEEGGVVEGADGRPGRSRDDTTIFVAGDHGNPGSRTRTSAMRRSKLLFLAAVLASACAHAPASAPSTPRAPAAPTIDEPEEPPPEPELPVATAADPDTTVLVMEADDLGGGADAIIAPPKRPELPSMMTDVAMAPSR